MPAVTRASGTRPPTGCRTPTGQWGSLTYYYDGVGNRTYEILTQGGITTTNVFGYPSNSNRMGAVTQGVTTGSSFAHDGAGNIVTDSRAGTTYSYRHNNRGRLDQVTVGTTVTAITPTIA